MPELPAGTVTFLFTDIEGSTRLLKKLRSRYAEVLSEHQRILRDVADAAGGHEIDTQGDAFFFVFERARDAVAAAAAAQHALAEHRWPDGEVLRVRMGLHTGEPTVGEGRYVGLGVHRGARICSAGHGGQVLLSNATRELVEDELEGEFELRDLGEHLLKDIDRPERLFQLVVPGLPSEFPPLKTAGAQPETPFAGREPELAEAARTTFAPRWTGRPLALGVLVLGLLATATVIALLLRPGGDAAETELAPESLATLDAASAEVRGAVDVGGDPSLLAAGEGSVWVANIDDQTLTRIDPETRTVERTRGLGFAPSGLAVGAGAVWVSDAARGELARVNAFTAAVERPLELGVGGFEAAAPVAVGAGSVWVALSKEFLVARVDPEQNRVVAEIEVTAPQAIAVGPDGIWVAEGATALAEIDPATDSVVGRIDVDFTPGGLAVGAGSLWASNPDEDVVWRFDLRTRSATGTIPVGQGPRSLAFGGGALWVANTIDGTITKISPERGEAVATTPIGHRPNALAFRGGTVWVAIGEA